MKWNYFLLKGQHTRKENVIYLKLNDSDFDILNRNQIVSPVRNRRYRFIVTGIDLDSDKNKLLVVESLNGEPFVEEYFKENLYWQILGEIYDGILIDSMRKELT